MSDAALRAAEAALFAAIASRDPARLAPLVADEFVLHTPDAPPTPRAAFLDGVAAIPGEDLRIDGVDVTVRRHGDLAVVAGVQRARLRLDGADVEDRSWFVDLFAWRDDRWLLIEAWSAPLPAAT